MKNDGLDSRLKNAFNDIQNIPPRHPQAEARGKADFLEQAAVIRQIRSRKADQPHHSWFNTTIPLFQRKGRLTVLNTLIAVIIVVIIIFGGTGATVYAAQDSLPDQALYSLKTWSEDAILSVTGSPQMRLNYTLDFSDRRLAEMASLLAVGKPILEGVETHFQSELDLALELTAGMDDSQAIPQMEQVRQRSENMMQAMTLMMTGSPESERPLLVKAHARLQEQIQLATMGESDLPGFRIQVRQRFQNQGGSGESTTGAGSNPQGHGPINPTDTPVPSGTGNSPAPVGTQPMETSGQLGSGSQTPHKTLQPTNVQGQYGLGSQTPDKTPQPGGGSGHGP
jgi:hypothetical protein